MERAGPGNASTLHSPAPTSGVPGGVAAWLQEVVTPVMLSLSGLVLGIAALILVLLVRHHRDEADTSLRLHQVTGASLLHCLSSALVSTSTLNSNFG